MEAPSKHKGNLMTKNKFITFEEAYEKKERKKERSKKIFIGSYITIILILISLLTFFLGNT